MLLLYENSDQICNSEAQSHISGQKIELMFLNVKFRVCQISHEVCNVFKFVLIACVLYNWTYFVK